MCERNELCGVEVRKLLVKGVRTEGWREGGKGNADIDLRFCLLLISTLYDSELRDAMNEVRDRANI